MVFGFVYEKGENLVGDSGLYTYWFVNPWQDNAWCYAPKDYLHATRFLSLGFVFMCVGLGE